MTSIDEIIKKAMQFILTGDTLILKILREQYKNSIITKIDKSPVVCFVEFDVINNSPKIEPKNSYIGDVFLESSQVPLGVGTILYIENGVISMLEFYTYGDDILPDIFFDFKFVYCNGKRDFNTYLS